MTVYRRDDIAQQWPEATIFAQVKAQQGEVFRSKEGRRTVQFRLAGKPYFLKYHAGVGWGEIVKNLVQLRLPIISAKSEWQAIRFLESHDLSTLSIAAYGERGWNPAKKSSFLVTDELTRTMSLEHLGAQWRASPPSFQTKKILIEKLASIAKVMHENGMNHRDFYLCHFLLNESFAEDNTITAKTELHLIDLHRAQIRQQTPRRWQIKDLGSLYYSASNILLTQGDLLRFMVAYTGRSVREVSAMSLWHAVITRKQQLQQRERHG